MRFGKDLDNKPIISVSDGAILGRTKDLYVNQDLTQLAGLYVGSEGVIRRTDKIIPTEYINLFGIDVILVQDPDVISTTKAVPESDKWHRLSDLYGKEARTPGGTRLAALDDVLLDEQGAISGFSLSRVYVSGPLADRPFIPREVVVDAFQSGDVLLVDFPQLEAIYADSEQEKDMTVPDNSAHKTVGDEGEQKVVIEEETNEKD
jgi:sporulation protein YlmC with PRC-barrel domain